MIQPISLRRKVLIQQTVAASQAPVESFSEQFWSYETVHRLACGPLHPIEPVINNWPLVTAALRRFGMPEKEVAAAAVGTIGIETAHTFKPVMEAYYLFGTADNFDVAACDEYLRTHSPSKSYYPYYGRGLVQTTWLGNYREGELELGIPLIAHPELAFEVANAANLLALYFRNHGVADAARARNWSEVRYSVLGGYEGSAYIANVAEELLAA